MKMDKALLRKILYFFGMLLGGGLFVFQFGRSIVSFAASGLNPAGIHFLVLAFMAVVLVRGIQMTAWHALMQYISPSLKWIDVAEKYTATLLSRYIPGSIWGYISRAEWLRAEHRIPYGVTNFISAVEIALVILTGMLAAVVYGFSIASAWLDFGLALLLIGLFILPWLLLRRIDQWAWFQRLMAKVFKIFETRPIPLSAWVKAALLDLVAWYGFGMSLKWIIQALQPSAFPQLDLTTMVYAAAWLAGFLVIFVPSGLGIREQTIITLSNSFHLTTTAISTSASILMRLLISGGELAWVFFGIIIKAVRQKKE